jgi:hypothetical protein
MHPEEPGRTDRALSMLAMRRPSAGGLRPVQTISPSAYVIDWPYPQIIQTNSRSLVIRRDGIYEYGADEPMPIYGLAEEMPVTMAGGYSLATTEVEVSPIADGSNNIWHVADFYDTVYLFRGDDNVIMISGFGDSARAILLTGNNVRTGCAHKEGRLFLGGLTLGDIAGAMQGMFQAYVAGGDNIPPVEGDDDPLPGLIQSLIGAGQMGENWCWWSSIGGGDALMWWAPYLLFTPIVGSLYGDTMPFCVDLWRRNQMGAAPMPFAGRVLRQVPLDAHVVVYGEDGLSALTTGHASGIVGKAPVSGFSSRVGIASRGAACGSDDGHAFVDQFGTLWTLDGRLQAERVGFQKDLSRLVGPNMQMSLNPERREFHISTADECYVYGRDGFYRHKPVTSMAVLGGTLTGGLEDTAEVLPGPWGPSVVYVDKAATGEDDGTSWEDAFTTIMAGVVSASLSATESAPITVMVSEGEYSEAITLSPHVQLFGGFDKTETHPVQRGYQFTTMVPPDTTGWGTDTPAMSGLNANGVTIDGFRFVRPDTVTSAWDAAIRLVNSSGTVSRCEFLDLFQTAVDVPHRSSPNTSVVTVKNCVFARLNGAIQRQEAHVHVYNCTFWDTTVHVEADEFHDSLLWTDAGVATPSPISLNLRYCCVKGVTQGTFPLVCSDPMLTDPDGNDFSPRQGSPLIDRGDPNGTIMRDIKNRFRANRIDIGAIETAPAVLIARVETNWFQSDPSGAPWTLSGIVLTGHKASEWRAFVKYRRRLGEDERETAVFTPDLRGCVACSITACEFKVCLYSEDEDCTLDGLDVEGDFGRRSLLDWIAP